jgi:hypothetical protein
LLCASKFPEKKAEKFHVLCGHDFEQKHPFCGTHILVNKRKHCCFLQRALLATYDSV